jgi:hypothetical protein
MTPAERDECVALYETGATLDRLAEIFDRGRCTIERLIARRGVKRGDKFRLAWKKGGVPLSVEHREKLSRAQLTYCISITTQENTI